MHVERHAVTVVTASDGTATAYSPAVTGRVLAVVYAKAGSGGYADGVDFDLTLEATGQALWSQDDVNSSAVVYPRAQAHGTDGAALEYADSYAVCEPVAAANDRVKIQVAQGGDTKTGTFYIIVG